MANRMNFGKRFENDYRYFSSPIRFNFAELHQIGELSCEAGYTVEEHQQQVFEVTYIVSGKGTVVTDGRSYSVEENDVFINSPGQQHTIRADRGTPLYFCYLGFSFIGSYNVDLGLERFFRSWNGATPLNDKYLLVLFLRAIEELRNKNSGYLTMAGAYAEQIIMEIYRCRSGRNAFYAAELHAGDAAFAVARYVDRCFRDVDDIRELAGQLGYSYTYLAHVFKERTGETIGAYIISKKMEEAKWLLRTGRLSVTQLAARFRYQSVQSFSNGFKKTVGISPAEYQAMSAQELAAFEQSKQ